MKHPVYYYSAEKLHVNTDAAWLPEGK